MPTTCGFPNCKFRSRYRGQEDNRHFYRIPKRPSVLRQRWLEAIGRTEETVVSQVCPGRGYLHSLTSIDHPGCMKEIIVELVTLAYCSMYLVVVTQGMSVCA